MTNWYGGAGLVLASSSGFNLSNFRLSHLRTAFDCTAGGTNMFSDLQIASCQTPFALANSTISLRNALVYDPGGRIDETDLPKRRGVCARVAVRVEGEVPCRDSNNREGEKKLGKTGNFLAGASGHCPRGGRDGRAAPSPSPSAAPGDGTNVSKGARLVCPERFRGWNAGGDIAAPINREQARCPYLWGQCQNAPRGVSRHSEVKTDCRWAVGRT
jgi:hypothetical protein